jgi:hypothetical protein
MIRFYRVEGVRLAEQDTGKAPEARIPTDGSSSVGWRIRGLEVLS